MNEKIVQVIVKDSQILGLTASGHLARFDENMNSWVIRSKCDVLDSNNKVVIAYATNTPEVNARAMASEAISSQKEPVKKDDFALRANLLEFVALAVIGALTVLLAVIYMF
jgi:hypothetical protein